MALVAYFPLFFLILKVSAFFGTHWASFFCSLGGGIEPTPAHWRYAESRSEVLRATTTPHPHLNFTAQNYTKSEYKQTNGIVPVETWCTTSLQRDNKTRFGRKFAFDSVVSNICVFCDVLLFYDNHKMIIILWEYLFVCNIQI